MSIAKDFKEFALKGNVIDLAVGMIIGAAFAKIVTSLVADIIMPVVGSVFGNLDFAQLFVALGDVPAGVPMVLADLQKAGVPVLAYGNFITVAINFLILAFIIFMMVRQVIRLKRAEAVVAAEPAVTPEDVSFNRCIRPGHGLQQAGCIGYTKTCNIKSCAVVWAGPNKRQTQCHIHTIGHPQVLDGYQPLVVVSGNHHIKLASPGAHVHRVWRQRVADLKTQFASCTDSWRHDVYFLSPKTPPLASVRIDPGNGYAQGACATQARYPLVGQQQRLQQVVDSDKL